MTLKDTVLAYDQAGADRGNELTTTKELASYDADARAALDFLRADAHGRKPRQLPKAASLPRRLCQFAHALRVAPWLQGGWGRNTVPSWL